MVTTRELIDEMTSHIDRQYLIIKAKSKDAEDDKIQLSRQQKAIACRNFQLGYWAVSEEGVIQWQSTPCQQWDLCPRCRQYEASKRRQLAEATVAKLKEENPSSKTRVKYGIPSDEVASFEKKIKRHGGRFESIEGKEEGTRDIVVEMEDDPKRTSEQMDEIYGQEENIKDYDFECSLARQKKRGGKRMAGALCRGKSVPIKQEDTERMRLPKFRVKPEDNKKAKEISKEILPTYKVNSFIFHQEAIYGLAERFAARLEEESIEYDVKMDFKNIVPEDAQRAFNVLVCPNNVTVTTDNNNQTFDPDQPEFLAAEAAQYQSQ